VPWVPEPVFPPTDPALTETGRELRQHHLTRVILDKVESEHLLVDPLKANGVLHALVSLPRAPSSRRRRG
jgi:hypothetical protein